MARLWPRIGFLEAWRKSQIPSCQVLKTLPKDRCLCSNFLCHFTICQEWWWTPEHCTSHHSVTCILANQDPFRMVQGDWSLGVLLARTLADTKRHSSWWSCPPFKFAETVAIAASYQCPNNGATASSLRNTQPTHRLGCITGVLFMSFSSAIPLWSSIEHRNRELVSQKSHQHRNPSLAKGKQMSCCRFQVAPGGSRSFSKPWSGPGSSCYMFAI